jgi:trehalose synthase-fused probable maltokinase
MTPTLRIAHPWPEFAAGPGREVLATGVLPTYLARQRWFPAKSRAIASISIEEAIGPPDGECTFFVVQVAYGDGVRHRFAVPLAVAEGDEEARVRREAPERVVAEVAGARQGILHDDLAGRLGRSLLVAIARSQRWPASRGVLEGERTTAFDAVAGGDQVDALAARRITAEQSNTSVVFGDRVVVKLIRRLEPGLNPDYEIGRHLTERARFPGVPAMAGAVLWRAPAGAPTVVAVAQAFVPGAVALREHLVAALASFMRDQLDRAATSAWTPAPGACRDAFDGATALGRKTGRLHVALSEAHGDAAFTPEALGPADLAGIARGMQAQVDAALAVLEPRVADLPGVWAALASRVLTQRTRLAAAIGRVPAIAPGLQRIRLHGDYQLDQVLLADGDFAIIDFEGEPLRPVEDRRAKFLALKDVAGMARSYSYAAYAALFAVAGDDESLANRLDPVARWWEGEATAAFVRGYRETVAGAPFLPADQADFDTLLDAFLVEKAAYELRYEVDHRPRWLRIPLRGVADLLDRLER